MFSKNKQNKLRLCNISFKINILNFPRVLPPWSPNEPTDGLTVPPTPSYILFPNSCKTLNVFHSCLIPCLFITPICYCDNIGQQLFQFLLFQSASHCQFFFTKIAEMCNECTMCVYDLVYN